MEFDEYRKVFQKDVNNYIVVPSGPLYDENGKPRWKSKGSYVKKQNPLDYDLPIVNKAMIEFMINNVPIEKTIGECDDLIMFQKIVKLSGKFKFAIHNNKILNEKCFRVFASNDSSDSYIGKQKDVNRTIEQFANTPEHCYIDNEDVKNKKVDSRLNKDWYIDMTKKRLKQFGVI